MSNQALTPYLHRLQVLYEQGFISKPNHSKYHKEGSNVEIVFLDTEQGVAKVGDAIVEGFPVVSDYGSTYGTTFLPEKRLEVAKLRQEQEPLPVVSLVTMTSDVYSWIDMSRIHPAMRPVLEDQGLSIIEDVMFFRFPANATALRLVGPHCINEDGEIQALVVSEHDPLMRYLRDKHELHFVAVRSSNIAGNPEEAFITGALEYAHKINVVLFAIRSLESFYAQVADQEKHTAGELLATFQRQRVGSIPILRLPHVGEDPVIKLVRAGNIHPESTKRLLRDVLGNLLQFEYVEEKNTSFRRKEYQVHSAIKHPEDIHRLLKRAAHLV